LVRDAKIFIDETKLIRDLKGTLRRTEIDSLILSEHHHTVAAGPFKGMQFISEPRSGRLSPKILGTYERELHPIVRQIMESDYECVINVGCAEGYYAVGLARSMKDIVVHAYDIDKKAIEELVQMAELNAVSEKIVIGGVCDANTLNGFPYKDCILICDIEGNERTLLNPSTAPRLLGFDILVEIHDGSQSTEIHDLLVKRFRDSHNLEFIRYQGRNRRDCASIKSLKGGKSKIIAVDEFRRVGLEWGFFKLKKTVRHRRSFEAA
jgi:hypothetical protein